MTDRCKRCGGPLPYLAIRDRDEYCSVACCQRDHGMNVEDGEPYNRRVTRLMPREPSDRWRRIPVYPAQRVDEDELDGPSL
jgi:hypothetical protein